MTGPTWTQPIHCNWLIQKLPLYHDAQKRKTVTRFLKTTYEAWFQAFPLREEVFPGKPLTQSLTDAEKLRVEALRAVRKKQIKTWFSWRRLRNLGKKGHRGGRRTSGAKDIDELANMLNIKVDKKERRAPQRIEVYQAKYKAAIWTAIKQELQLNPPPPGVPIAAALVTTRRSVTQRMLDAATPEIHQEIDDYIADWKANKSCSGPSEDDEDEDEDEEPTPEQYQKAIELLPEFLERFFGPCSRATGWNFFLMGAGPNPAMGGKVYMETYHFGAKSPAGNTFSEAYVDFKQNVSALFCKYAMSVHTPDICAARAMTTRQTDAESLANASPDAPPTSSTTTPSPSATTAASVSSTAASACPTAPAISSINDARLDHSINANQMIVDNTGPDQRFPNAAGLPTISGSFGSSTTLDTQAAGGLTSGGGLLDWERDLLASMGDISHEDLFGMDYMDSAFTDLPNASMLGTAYVDESRDDGRGGSLAQAAQQFPVAQAVTPTPGLAQTGACVDGFIFPNNNVIDFGGLSQPARSPVLVDTEAVDRRVPEALATEATGPMIIDSHTDLHMTQPTVERRITAHVNLRLGSMDPGTTAGVNNSDPTAMGDISNKVTQPKKGRGSNKRKAEPEVGPGGEPENTRRPKRKIVAPARRDKTPELASSLRKMRVE